MIGDGLVMWVYIADICGEKERKSNNGMCKDGWKEGGLKIKMVHDELCEGLIACE